ncbi:MAG: hypothetical protein AUI95_00805 [Crenarchaeota archaeon 13_1_40CM_3_52_4]|nr:MAG: hypothetical protein AUI95_00805 [Crenarchaeota archaeon 13_1_40CM_3_52_4]
MVLVFVVIIVNWFIFEGIPGQNGAQQLLSSSPRLAANSDVAARLCAQWNCHASRTDQFIAYFHSMLTFQFGVSFDNGEPISHLIVQSGRLQNTLLLLGSSTLISILIGVALGIAAAHKRGSLLDSFAVSGSLTTFALPTFWIGLVLILFLAKDFPLFPGGSVSPLEWTLGPSHVPNILAQIPIRLQYLFLPALTLTLFTYGGFVLLTRATMMDALSEDYILTARAKGLSQRRILFGHAFKNPEWSDHNRDSLQLGRSWTLALSGCRHKELSSNASDVLLDLPYRNSREFHRRRPVWSCRSAYTVRVECSTRNRDCLPL